jgi:hypothetical protein
MQVFWCNWKKFVEMKKRILKFHRAASTDESKKIYEKYAEYCKLALKAVMAMTFGVSFGCILIPLGVKLFTGDLVLPFGFKLPWIDESTAVGYSINFCHHMLQSYITGFGFSAIDGMFAINMLQSYCVFDELYLMLDELNEDLKDRKRRSSPEIRKQLVKIVQKHQDLLRY